VFVRDLAPAGEYEAGSVRVTTHDVPHTPESLAIRVEALETGASLVYTGDTGPDEGLAMFAGSPDLLLAECSLPDDLVGDNHLSPSRVARLATRAAARRVIATHVYPRFRQAADVTGLIRAAGFEGTIELAREGLEIRL
jgi:ribonuclease BN (tRNA processing enzyme)